ncbi:class I SAM-dependent methyltransferase [Acidiphilium sp. AL]|uniref:class I SAM-dependent methyltransferase n=1 Tax=Acidiphilium sp. AL TaxID=2871704 RepID=UPI0021CB2B48|nr:class I SAM-dependent methyltransferase [Acidiphilium sp. AL]MCU4159632.1 class I SAM-dependent methyltransferase [Acidiphilium sp. AL]
MTILKRGLRGMLLARAYRKILHSWYLNDIAFDVRLAAKREAVAYIIENMQSAMMLRDRFDLLRFALVRAPEQGLVLEFGVEKGLSIACLGNATKRTVHGFDSFEGLPEDWVGTAETRGAFNRRGALPKVPANVRLHVGWFDATLPAFLAETTEPVSLLHIDCDIYSATATIFSLLAPRIVPGTVIVFDEYFNYPGWRQHEYKAFQEFCASSGRRYRYLGYAGEKGHVAVVIE